MILLFWLPELVALIAALLVRSAAFPWRRALLAYMAGAQLELLAVYALDPARYDICWRITEVPLVPFLILATREESAERNETGMALAVAGGISALAAAFFLAAYRAVWPGSQIETVFLGCALVRCVCDIFLAGVGARGVLMWLCLGGAAAYFAMPADAVLLGRSLMLWQCGCFVAWILQPPARARTSPR